MDVKFIPFRITEENMPKAITNGHIYFTVDTGKIYVDTANGRISMGNVGVSVLYGDFPKDAKPDANTEKSLSVDEAETRDPSLSEMSL